MTRALTQEEREELEQLLPWYAAGTLDAKSANRVAAAVEQDTALAHSLELIREDSLAARELIAEEPVPTTMEARFHAQMNAAKQGDAAASVPRSSAARAGLFARVGDWLTGMLTPAAPQRLAYAAVAVALIIVVQSGVIVSLVGQDSDGGGFVTAAGDAVAEGPSVLVQMAPDVDMSALSAFLADQNARIVDGPRAGGMFVLRFTEAGEEEQDEIVARLSDRDEFFALVLPGQ